MSGVAARARRRSACRGPADPPLRSVTSKPAMFVGGIITSGPHVAVIPAHAADVIGTAVREDDCVAAASSSAWILPSCKVLSGQRARAGRRAI